MLFVVASGACTVASTATCFRSPNYPSAYGNSQACTITVNEAVLLSVTAFTTESCCDKLTVNGVQYSGTNGPGGVQVAAGSTITWTSDSSVTRTGFQICGTGTGAYSLSTVRGHCQFRGKRDGGLRVGRNAGGETLRSEVHVLTALTVSCRTRAVAGASLPPPPPPPSPPSPSPPPPPPSSGVGATLLCGLVLINNPPNSGPQATWSEGEFR